MEKSAQAGEGGGGGRPPFHPITITYNVAVYTPAKRADTLTLFSLYPYMYSVVNALGFAVGSTAVAPPTTQPAAGLSCSCGRPAARQACEISVLRIRIRCLFLTPGSGIRDPGWIKNQDPVQIIFPRASKPIFVDNILKFFNANPRSGIERIRIWDPGSGLSIGSATLRNSICKSEIKGTQA
jgi:hypothetical protein